VSFETWKSVFNRQVSFLVVKNVKWKRGITLGRYKDFIRIPIPQKGSGSTTNELAKGKCTFSCANKIQ